jgi:hypothetical protein
VSVLRSVTSRSRSQSVPLGHIRIIGGNLTHLFVRKPSVYFSQVITAILFLCIRYLSSVQLSSVFWKGVVHAWPPLPCFPLCETAPPSPYFLLLGAIRIGQNTFHITLCREVVELLKGHNKVCWYSPVLCQVLFGFATHLYTDLEGLCR